VVAPGEEVWSSFHNETGFRFMSGTSMATAHVAGLAALHAQDSGARGRALLNLLRKAANNGQQNPGVLDAGLLKAP
jgi:subtilisin family serine protease